MNIPRLVVEKIPSARYQLANFLSKTVYRKAFKGLGAGSVIINPLRLKGTESISIGESVIVLEGAWLQSESGGQLTIGHRTYIGHRSHLHAVADLSIGADCVIADNVLINNGEHLKGNISEIGTRGPIVVGDRVFIGQNVTVLGGVTIGNDAIIGAGSVVTRDIPAGTTAVGIPARPITSK